MVDGKGSYVSGSHLRESERGLRQARLVDAGPLPRLVLDEASQRTPLAARGMERAVRGSREKE